MKKIKKVLGILIAVIIVILVLVLLLGKGFGFGNGNGSGNAEGEGTKQTVVEESTEINETDAAIPTEEIEQELPDEITITIKEDKVFVEDKQIENSEELKTYIEEINTDSKEYYLVDENSILDTYEWVTSVFDELKIKLVTE